MGTFQTFLEKNKITAPQILRTSARLEAGGKEGRLLLKSRATKRRTEAGKSYADAGLAKPPAGRGLGQGHLTQALADAPLPRKVRAKIVRAVSALLAKKGQKDAIDTKALFGEVAAKKGAKVEKAAAA